MDLIKQFPALSFAPSNVFKWSPRRELVMYDASKLDTPQGKLSLLHEIGHALLQHQSYEFDIELMRFELEAWQKASALSEKCQVPLDEDHIDSCLEGYRNWLYRRSRCPKCSEAGIQTSSTRFECFICGNAWRVARSRSLHPKRMAIL